MSNALPMTHTRRAAVYLARGRELTPRQRRQLTRMGLLESYRHTGALTHGASGARVRKPIARSKAAREVTS